MKIIDANENLFPKNYLEYNKKEYFNHKKIDKILVKLIVKTLFLFCNIPYFDFLNDEILHLTHNLGNDEISHLTLNLGKNYHKNLNYSKKLQMIDWSFFKKSYKFLNHFKSFLLGNYFRTALPGYDSYIYLMKLSLNFIMTLMTYFSILE